MSFRKQLIYLIVISLLVRLLIAYSTELGNDEVYYYTYALHLQWNYFDHPPGVALLIKLTTFNLWLSHEVFIRLGAIAGAAAGTWLSYQIGMLIRNERTGFYAAVLYNSSIYTSIIAGTFILPDSPQVVCWLAALLILIKMVLQLSLNQRITALQWLLFGLLSGVCIQCKVHGIFLWFGFVLYLLFYQRNAFSQPMLYVSSLVTLIIISPILIWNINNHFITFTYHSSRVEVHRFAIHFNSFLQALLGQIFYNNPINAVFIFIGLFSFRSKRFLRPDLYRILLMIGLPVIIVVTLISLFNSVLPHWSGPGFLSLSFVAAAYLDATISAGRTSVPASLKSSLLLIVIVVAGGIGLINFYPGTLGSKNKETYGSGDFTLDISGWKNFAQQYNTWLVQQKDSNNYRHLQIVCNKWFPASHLEYYVARSEPTEVVGIGNLNDLHQFAWLNRERQNLKKGDDALCIVPSNYSTDVAASYQPVFSSITTLHTFTAKRGGMTSRYFDLYLLKNYNATDEVHTMVVK